MPFPAFRTSMVKQNLAATRVNRVLEKPVTSAGLRDALASIHGQPPRVWPLEVDQDY